MSFTECLGPCSESNVVFLYLHGRPRWFRRVNTPARFAEVLRYADAAGREPGAPLPAALERCSFTWTGGGVGPKPPVPDADTP
jgi:(2Fe-2S) ferredoxin